MNKLIYLCTTIALSFSTNADAQLKRLEYMLTGDLNGSGVIWDSTVFEYDNANQGFIDRNVPDIQVWSLNNYSPEFDMDMTQEDDLDLFPYSFTEFKKFSKYYNSGILELDFAYENNWISATDMESNILDENGDVLAIVHFTYDAAGNITKIVEFEANNGTIGDTLYLLTQSYLNGNLINKKYDVYQNNQYSYSWELNFEYDNSNLVLIEYLDATNSGWRRRAYFDGSFMDSLLEIDVNNNIENIETRHLFTNNGLRYDSYNRFNPNASGNNYHSVNYNFFGGGSRIDSVYGGYDQDPNSYGIAYYTYDGNYVTDIRARSYDNGQYSALDHRLHFEYTDILDIQEQDMERTISVFPNPTTDILSFDKSLEGEFTVVNMNGQVLIKGTLSNSQINVGHLPAGTYILKVSAGKENYTSRFIKE